MAASSTDTFIGFWVVVITFIERAVEPVCQHATHGAGMQVCALLRVSVDAQSMYGASEHALTFCLNLRLRQSHNIWVAICAESELRAAANWILWLSFWDGALTA